MFSFVGIGNAHDALKPFANFTAKHIDDDLGDPIKNITAAVNFNLNFLSINSHTRNEKDS